MIGECLRETCDLDGMQTRELIAGGFQLNCGRVSGEITNVGPVEYFDRPSTTGESSRSKSSPKTLQADVSTGYAPIAGGFNYLDVVDRSEERRVGKEGRSRWS